jgi:O-antigen/teichoic acid export membrane protein
MVRVLPVEQIGIHRVFFFYIQSIPSFSLSSGFINGIYYWGGRGADGRARLQSAGALLLWISFIFTIILFIFQKPFAAWLGFDFSVSLLFILACIPQIMNMFYESSEIATGHIWRGAGFSAFFEFTRAFVLLFFLFWKRDIVWILIAHTTLMWLKLFLGILLGRKRNLFRFLPEKSRISSVLHYAGPVSWAAVFDQLVSYPDRYILTALISKAEFAFYSVGCLSLSPLMMFEVAINKVLIPELSEAFSQLEYDRVAQLYREAVRELMLFLLPATMGLIVFSEPIMELLFTRTYVGAQSYLKIYALTYLLIAIPFDVVFRATGDSRWILRTQIMFGIISLLLVWICTLSFGATGTLWATVGCQALLRVYSLREMKKRIPRDWSQLIPWRDIRLFSTVVFILSILSLLVRRFFEQPLSWFLVCGSLFAISYLICMSYFEQFMFLNYFKKIRLKDRLLGSSKPG